MALKGGMAENRSTLLRRDGLSAAKEVLYELDKYLSNRLHSFAVPTVDGAVHDLIEEFIFQEPPGSPSTGKKFSSLQELQLLEIISSYFHEQSKDALRQLVFSSLFKPRGNMADPARLSLLSRLLSMAVAVAHAPVLDCTAVWMQRTPVPFCTELVQSLVEDYCSLVPVVITTLQQAVTTSPRFCCQLITAITTLYDLSSGAFTPPPNLLNVVVTWVCEKPQLTLHNFLNSPIPASSPQGFLDLTPLAGLITWCVLSPLVTWVGSKADADALGSSTVIMNEQKSEKFKQEGEGAEDDQTLMYSRLHLGVLQVLQLLYSHMAEKKLLGRLALISLDQVSTLMTFERCARACHLAGRTYTCFSRHKPNPIP
uniref:integrator complex subunit 15 isoform X2 n=1 Tax=Myxine glutinosa TaxID=7769 RepID=UPI00358EA77D